jgi:hypothetical protein
LTRFYPVQLIDPVQAGDSIGAKAYVGGMSKRKGFKWDTFSGVEMSRRLGRLVHKMRLIDKVGNRYVERVIDPKTGQVLRDVDHPLTEHVGRGSAKPRGG